MLSELNCEGGCARVLGTFAASELRRSLASFGAAFGFRPSVLSGTRLALACVGGSLRVPGAFDRADSLEVASGFLSRARAAVGGGGGDRLAEAVGLGAGELLFPAGCSFPGIQPSGRARFLVIPPAFVCQARSPQE